MTGGRGSDDEAIVQARIWLAANEHRDPVWLAPGALLHLRRVLAAWDAPQKRLL